MTDGGLRGCNHHFRSAYYIDCESFSFHLTLDRFLFHFFLEGCVDKVCMYILGDVVCAV